MRSMNAPLDAQHRNRLLFLGIGSIAVLLPLNLQGWVLASGMRGWDVVFTAQAASLCSLILLTVTIAIPLFMGQTREQRMKGFVLFWFAAAVFFNLVWELPLVLFKAQFAAAEVTRDNLAWAIGWWGYGFADHHYGQSTPFMIVMEIWFLIANLFAVGGFVKLRSAPRLAWLLFGIAGALQAYNVSIYAGLMTGVESLSLAGQSSGMSLALYWGFNQLWLWAGLLASLLAFRLALRP